MTDPTERQDPLRFLSKAQRVIFEAIGAGGEISNAELMKRTGYSSRTVERAKARFKTLGLAKFDGADGGSITTIYQPVSTPVRNSKTPPSEIADTPVKNSTTPVRNTISSEMIVSGTTQVNAATEIFCAEKGLNYSVERETGNLDLGRSDSRSILSVNAHTSFNEQDERASQTEKWEGQQVENRQAESWENRQAVTEFAPFSLSSLATPYQPDSYLSDDDDLLAAIRPCDEELSWIDENSTWGDEGDAVPSLPTFSPAPVSSFAFGPALGPAPALPTLLCIDPATRAVGWAVFVLGAGPATLLASGNKAGDGTHNSDRIIECGKFVSSLIETYKPTQILLEAPDYSRPYSDPRRLQVLAAGVRQIEAAIAASGLPLHRLPASRHKDRYIKIRNREMFHDRVGRHASEDEADAFRLGMDFLEGAGA